jgi:lipid-binding SYLF domain-containing protein
MKRILATAVLALSLAPLTRVASAEADMAKLDGRIDAAHAVLHELMATPDKGVPLDIASRATCIVVIPSFKKGAFVVGGAYGQGVASCRTGHGWSAPVFVQMEGASFGFQIGGQSTDLVLIGVNHKSLEDMLKEKVKIGGDIAASAGPVGRNSGASTSILANAEFLTYSRSRGLFAGVDLTGDVIHQNGDDTRTYYGSNIPFQRVLSGSVPVKASSRHFVETCNELFKVGRAQR